MILAKSFSPNALRFGFLYTYSALFMLLIQTDTTICLLFLINAGYMNCSYLLYFWKMNHAQNIRIIGDSLIPGHYKRYASFNRIDNFVNNAGAIIAITDDMSLLAPNAIIVDKFYPEEFAQIIIHPNSITLNNSIFPGINVHQEKSMHHDNTACNIEDINIYSSDFVYPDIDVVQIQNTIQGFFNSCGDSFPNKSLLSLLIPSNVSMSSAFDKAAFAAFEHAFSLLPVRFFDSVSAFRGKGRGLTPSGDDFIAGLLYGIHCLESLTKMNHAGIKTRVYELAETNNLFSNNMLQLAREAKYFKRLKDFLSALLQNNPDKQAATLRQLTSVGDTSGADILAGFFALILQKPLIFDQ